METREGFLLFDISPHDVTVFEQMASDLASIFDDFAKTISIGGTDYRALVAEPELALELEAGGFNSAGNFTVKMLREDWLAAAASIGTQILYDQKSYRVIRVVSRPPHPVVIMTVEPV